MKSIYLSIQYIFILVIYFNGIYSRIHHLRLNDDQREQVTISTFGFLKNGFLQVRINKLQIDPFIDLQSLNSPFAFVLEKNQNRGFSSFSAKPRNQDFCSFLKKSKITKNEKENTSSSSSPSSDATQLEQLAQLLNSENFSLTVFHLDLIKKKANILRVGNDLKNLKIYSTFSSNYHGFNPSTTAAPLSSSNSSSNLTTSSPTTTNLDDELSSFLHENKPQLKSIDLELNQKSSSLSFQFEIDIASAVEEGLYIFNFYNCFQPDFNGKYDYKPKSINMSQANSKPAELLQVSDNYYPIEESSQYRFGINLDLELIERNEDSFLSAGELPLPTLYLTWSIIYFLAAISWMYILRSSKGGDVFKIHYLMLALVCIKSMTLTFHAINMHYIAINGTHETVWAILYYITYVLRGLLLIISILLVGTGWTFIKHVLSENERRLFVIIIPLQILAIAAYIFLEEKEEGDAVYLTWRKLFFLLDLVCCGAILFPVVWSIKHLEQGSKTDGKIATNLKKLKIFKHFYVMVICYVYFTRIIGFLLEQVIPFRYEWMDELCTEVATFIFFAMTAYKFQPVSNNPYLQLSQDDYALENANLDEDSLDEMETVFVAKSEGLLQQQSNRQTVKAFEQTATNDVKTNNANNDQYDEDETIFTSKKPLRQYLN